MFNRIVKLYKQLTNSKTLEELYLENSSSLEEIEYKLRQIDRGEAPFQKIRIG